MQLYNALTDRIEQFKPQGKRVTIYVCGITPYDTTHLGHAFTYATFDVLIRYLEYLGCRVTYAQNVTDIDDDILRKAKEVGQDWYDLGNRWTLHFIDDNLALNIRPPDHFPRATDVIDDIVTAVQAMLGAGLAYESAGNVYFHVGSDPTYGKLSRLSAKEMLPIANERGNNPDDPNKRDPLDFVLWQAQSFGEPAWDSPWGPGRPGWHIECSTMSTKYLGQPIDIHGGGADLLFPHHESEIAQAECAEPGRPFARFWLHTAMVRFKGEKMSKSLGNLVMIRDLLQEGWSADSIRLYMARNHYRRAWTHSEEDLAAAAELAQKLELAVSVESGWGDGLNLGQAEEAFESAMDSDLDTPAATGILVKTADEILKASEEGRDVVRAQLSLRTWCSLFGLRLGQERPEEDVIRGWSEHRRRFVVAG